MTTPVWKDAPRVGPDRPFPSYAFLPNRGMPHPIRDQDGHSHGVEEEVVSLPPERWREDEAYLRGIDLYHAGYLWEAHEAWEGIWKASTDDAQRAYLRALIQIAAALIQARLDNPRGVAKLLERAAEGLDRVKTARCMGVDTATLAGAVERTRTASSEAPRLAPYDPKQG